MYSNLWSKLKQQMCGTKELHGRKISLLAFGKIYGEYTNMNVGDIAISSWKCRKIMVKLPDSDDTVL